MPESWTDEAIRKLRDRNLCPRCGSALDGPLCGTCGANLDGRLGWSILDASEAAAVSLERRQRLIDQLDPATAAAAAAATATATAAVAAPAELARVKPTSAVATAQPPVPALGPPTIVLPSDQETRTSQLSLQSVLAVAGAGLVAVAAIVFAFFNPDLDSFALRTTIIAVSTLVFLGAAWLLARTSLQFSAEAVGALGTVFVGLDVWAFTDPATTPEGAYALAAIATLIAGAALITLGVLVRLRSWVTVGLIAIPLAALFAGLAVDEHGWGRVGGLVAATAVALLVHPLVTRIGTRFSSPMAADHGTSFVLQLISLVSAVALLPLAAAWSSGTALWSAFTLALLAAIALVSARHLAPAWWSWAAGALCAAALGVLALALSVSSEWYLALVPAGVLVAALVSAVTPSRASIRPSFVRAGVWTVAALTAVPGVIAMIPGVAFAILDPTPATAAQSTLSVAFMLELVAASAAGVALWYLGRRDEPMAGVSGAYLPVAFWHLGAAILLLATWPAFLRPTQVILSLVVAAGLSVLLARIRASALSRRLPLLVTAHALVALAGILSWQDEALRVGLGAAAVIAVVFLAFAMPRAVRPVYTAIGYSWALVVLSGALAIADLELIAVLCLTTSVAALVALVATIAPWPPVAHWYAILAVTSVPFVIGVGTVFSVRSGWTGLSTSVIFALLLVITFSRRAGLTRALRTVSAALLVPSLSVAIISLGAHFLAISASPVTLPVIAAVVACILPSTVLIGAGLERLGVSELDARWSRIAIEVSSLVTAAFAVVLALVRAAAGLPTTLIVLVILGAGAVATALFGRRRYGWLLAGIAFTGALWCVWALNGVVGLEPYLLPPTLGAAIVGFFLVARGLPGFGLSARGLYATGLATALAPILVTLAAIGSESIAPWRTWLLLGFAVGLTVLAAVIPALTRWRPLEKIAALRSPSLAVALVAAVAGVVQSVRYGLSLDGARVGHESVMVPVLVYTLASTAVAVAVGVLLSRRADAAWAAPARVATSRWLFVPAALFLVVGPIVAMRDGWFPIITLYAISVSLLALMVVTAVRARTREVLLPPVAVSFALAWCTAVASWSARDLRVEAYSLPLGFALLAVGVIAMWPLRVQHPTLWSWPVGFAGSWRLLAPGIVVVFLPSILATGTDPRTERAILVIVLALIAIMIGNLRRLAAPFILGIIVLPIENIVVFAVQVGRNIGAQPWWITLATAGAVLLVLAVTSERRVGQGKGAAARIRDLT